MTDRSRFTVQISANAESDLKAIATYIAEHQSPTIADRFMAGILNRIAALETFPLRGPVPKELERTTRHNFRQLVSGPTRIIYQVNDKHVIILLVADGRRDMRALIRDRLLAHKQST